MWIFQVVVDKENDYRLEVRASGHLALRKHYDSLDPIYRFLGGKERMKPGFIQKLEAL